MTAMQIHEHVYAPRGGCLDVFNSREPEVLVSGPAGTGKSRACLEKLFAICIATPNVRALIVRKTLTSLGSTALVTWRKFVIKEAMEASTVVYYGGSAEEPPQYRFRNGSRVIIGGLDRPTRIMSSEYDIIYVQESTELTLDDLELLKTRLRNWTISFQQLLMDCNPAGDKHWLRLRCNDRLTRLIESRHEDNPQLFDEVLGDDGVLTYRVTEKGAKYIDILDKLTGVRYKRLRLGLWVSAEGIIYEEFDPAHHILSWEFDEDGNRLPLPDEWPRYWVIDFGYVKPFVLKCFAVGPDGEHYMYREIYMTGRTVEEHAQTIMDIVAPETVTKILNHFDGIEHESRKREWIEPRPAAIICDHDTEDRRTFERKTGMGTIAARKDISLGIDLHKARLKIRPNGYAGFYLMADSLVELDQALRNQLLPTCTAEEYASYVWKMGNDNRLTGEPDGRCEDHGMDTDRYHTVFHDFRGKARITNLGS